MRTSSLLLVLFAAACSSTPPPPVTESWVITSISMPPVSEEGAAPGANLDDVTWTGPWCDAVPDHHSPLHGDLVDNALAGGLSAWPSPDFDRWIAGEIASARFVLVVERTEWGAHVVKGSLPRRRIRVVLARPPTAPVLDDAGRFAPDQTFEEVMELSSSEGSASGPGLDLFPSMEMLALPIGTADRRATIPLHDVHFELFTHFGQGELGAYVTVEELLAAHAALGAPIDEATLRMRVTPDLQSNWDGSVCSAVSLGMALELAPAALTPSGI